MSPSLGEGIILPQGFIMKDFNVDSIHDKVMECIEMLINDEIIISMVLDNQPQDAAEVRGFIKGLRWVMAEWEQ